MPRLGQPHCKPTYWCEPGHEDPTAHCAKGKKLYVVMQGTVCGVFSSEARAHRQVDRVSSSRWRMALSWDDAVQLWNENCDAYHEVGCPEGCTGHACSPPVPAPVQQTVFPTDDPRVIYQTRHLRPQPQPRPSVALSRRSHWYRLLQPALPALPALPARATCLPRQILSRLLLPALPKLPALPAQLAPTNVAQTSTATATNFVQTSASRAPKTPRAPRSLAPTNVAQTSTGRLVPPASPLSTMDAVEAFSRMGVAQPSADARPIKQWAIAGVNKFFADKEAAIAHIMKSDMTHGAIISSRNVNWLRAYIGGGQYIPRGGDTVESDSE
ncbi:hypothetical protein B0H14DRAFT_2562930 [Mycena olivaceomarginata]|nr:hypothetical protein B0H14DRAFT_2562930 [Mycena olivaceomarginata]